MSKVEHNHSEDSVTIESECLRLQRYWNKRCEHLSEELAEERRKREEMEIKISKYEGVLRLIAAHFDGTSPEAKIAKEALAEGGTSEASLSAPSEEKK